MKRGLIVSFVEDGWQSARALSMLLIRDAGLEVVHYIRGRIPRAVIEMMTPSPSMRIICIPRRWFKIMRTLIVIWLGLRRQLHLVIVDNERTATAMERLIGRWGIPVVYAQERFQQLAYQWDGQMFSAAEVVERLCGRRYDAHCAVL